MYIMLTYKILKIKYLILLVATNASLYAEINEFKGEIPNLTNLATSTALTAVKNKIPNICNLVKKN